MDTFTTAYIECALWSSLDDEGEPLDGGWHELAPETRGTMVADCAAFQADNVELLSESGLSDEQAGHDFWLTRCGHGAGFWDRGIGAVGNELTKAAKAYGNVDLYVGDDGLIYGC